MSEKGLFICQIAAVFLTALFSVLTIVAENIGEKRLSVKGRVALTAALISAVLALLTQGFQARADRKKAEDEAKRTQTLLSNIQRGVYPLFSPSIRVTSRWDVPVGDRALEPYVLRLTRGFSERFKRGQGDSQNCWHRSASIGRRSICNEYSFINTDMDTGKQQIIGVGFDKGSELFPRASELTAHQVLADFGVQIDIFREQNHSSDIEDADLRFVANANDDVGLSFNPGDHFIEIDGENMALDMSDFNSNGRIASLPDLSNATILVSMKDSPDASDDVLRLWKSEKLSYLEMNIGGRRVALALKPVGNKKYPLYSCRLPSSMEYTDDPNVRCGS